MNNSTPSNGAEDSSTEIMTSLSAMAWSFAFGVLAVMAIFGNLSVIFAFARDIRLRTRTNFIIVGLSTADLLVSFMAIPLYIAMIMLYTSHRKIHVALNVIYHAVDVFGGFASIFHLIFISLERFYAIAFPVNHRNSSKNIYRRALMGCWVAAGTLAFIHSIRQSDYNIGGAFFVLFCVCFFVAFIVICAAYFGIWRKTKEKKLIQKGSGRVFKRHQQEIMISMSILIVIIVFVLTWLPFFCINAIFFFEGTFKRTSIPFEVVQFTKLLHYSNSAINPIIYSLRIPGFRRTFTGLIRRESTRSLRISLALSRHDSTKNDQGHNLVDATIGS
ncbi:5-hydroxytryptamine receptor 4-like [Montipora foliosa]|uniref:5-hydroxytryptamine receptor 4-like n=1 Tax=Montipora foliosa TaxID=591990 RepID=UPI0035F1D632